MPKLSVVIITLNEAANLPRCLASLQGMADEVVVADSHSTDDTPQLARAAGARVLSVDWQGYAATKNLANAAATHDWILSIDADEALDEPLRASLLAWKAQPERPGIGVVTRRVWWGPHLVRYGNWNPDRKPRLFHRGQAQWAGGQVHETLDFDRQLPVFELKGHLEHYTTNTLNQRNATVARYAQLRAQDLFRAGRRAKGWQLWLKPGFAFFRSLVLKRGFLDGKVGLLVAQYEAWERFLRYAYLWELAENEALAGHQKGASNS
jgi:glycosyltransferase involved in cell wall biosynthesis